MRLFVALEIPAEVRESLFSLVERLRPKCREARWARPEGFHITIKFIGHVDEHAQPEKPRAIIEALASVASDATNTTPIVAHFRGLGFFPSEKRPRFFRCGVKASPNLIDLAQAIDRALVPLGVDPEPRPFVPHLTLARLSSSAQCPSLISAAKESQTRDFGSARETNFHLFESFTKPSGAEYKRLQTFSFAKGSL
jgi:2'-5' RNA ligase